MRSPWLRPFGLPAVVYAVAMLLASVPAFASDPDGPRGAAISAAKSATNARPGPAGAAAGARSAVVVGTAWNADNTPIPEAHLRLRNVLSGRVEAAAVANEAGRFTFTSMETGSYVVELVTDNGKILTVGHTFTVGPGETVATFVRLRTKVPWFEGFFGNAASAVSSAAASIGVTALAPEAMPCVSACAGTGR